MNCPVSPAGQPQYTPHSAVHDGFSVHSSEVEAADDVVWFWDATPVAESVIIAPPTAAPDAFFTSKTANAVVQDPPVSQEFRVTAGGGETVDDRVRLPSAPTVRCSVCGAPEFTVPDRLAVPSCSPSSATEERASS